MKLLSFFAPNNDEKSYSAPWLISFTDLIALMLAFFVLLYSTMRIEEESWNRLSQSLLPKLDPLALVDQPALPEEKTMPGQEQVFGRDLDYLASLLASQLDRIEELEGIFVQRLDDRVVISLPGTLLFESGGALLSGEGQEALALVVQVLRSHANRLLVVGHADPRTLDGVQIKNWMLSLSRAKAVAQALSRNGYSGSIETAGQGPAQFLFLDEGLSLEDRRALARRADIHLLEDASVVGEGTGE